MSFLLPGINQQIVVIIRCSPGHRRRDCQAREPQGYSAADLAAMNEWACALCRASGSDFRSDRGEEQVAFDLPKLDMETVER